MKQVYFILTDKCNLQCKHCIRDSRNLLGNVPIDDIKYAIKTISAKFPNATCILSGGDPTLHPNFPKILEYSLECFKGKISINTNGTTPFFRKNEYMNFDSHRVVYQVSLDGDSTIHNHIRGTGTFEQSISNITKLIESNKNVVVATTINAKNINNMEKLHDVIYKLGVKYWTIQKELPFGEAKNINLGNVTTEDWNKFCSSLLSYVNNDMRVIIRKLYDVNLLSKLSENEIDYIASKGIKNCGTATEKIYIHPDLTVYGCTCLEDFPLGNLKQNSFENILNSTPCKQLSDYSLLKDSPCMLCKYKKMCNGGCIGMSLRRFKKLGVGDIRCPLFNRYLKESTIYE